jgi:hypothetical protein
MESKMKKSVHRKNLKRVDWKRLLTMDRKKGTFLKKYVGETVKQRGIYRCKTVKQRGVYRCKTQGK